MIMLLVRAESQNLFRRFLKFHLLPAGDWQENACIVNRFVTWLS